jgi:transcriptional regulator with XRE-family HTH domain
VIDVGSDLASALLRLRQAAELSRRQLEDVSGVSEETIKGIEYSKNVRPTLDTLKKLATGLATNRALARVDPTAADEILSTLMQAAGYLPPRPTVGTEGLDPDILDRVRLLCGTDLARFRSMLDLLAQRPPEEREAALEFLLVGLQALNQASNGMPRR